MDTVRKCTVSCFLCGFLLIKFDQYLGVAFDALIKFLICIGCLFDLNTMAYDLAWLNFTIHNQISQIFVVLLYRSLAASHRAYQEALNN